MNRQEVSAAVEKPRFSARLWRPRGLFWKIFGWFLAAQLLIALALSLLAAATQRGFDQRLSEIIGGNLEERTRAAAIAYESGGRNALGEAWGRARSRPTFGERERGFGRGPRGGGRRGPTDIEAASFFVLRVDATNPATLLAQHLIGPPDPARQFPVAARAPAPVPGDAARPEILPAGEGATYLLRRVETARGGRYLGVVRWREGGGRPGRWFDQWLGGGPGAPAAPWRLATIALTMSALCYALARYLTAPALTLRRATQQFAAGDFSTRVGPQMGARRDELADLGRDFDQMAERIENLLLAQRQLLGDISHELRSPLTRLSLALELAAQSASQSADTQTGTFLTRIENEVGEMNRLIGQLLTIARLENGAGVGDQTSREAAYIDLAHLIEHVAQNADFEARSRGGTVLITHLEAAEIVGNGELLHSALENVVRNALLHGPEIPRVEVSLHLETQNENPNGARTARIRVRDYGDGVPEAALESLFEPFFRVAAARDRQSGGTGLGLSITRRAARFHGGQVRAKNVSGGGLEVEISLPLSAAPAPEHHRD